MKYKDAFGQMEYTLGDFFVMHRTGSTGKYSILKREPWKVTDPMWIEDDDLPFWDKPPLFDSFIQAVRWLKEHISELH